MESTRNLFICWFTIQLVTFLSVRALPEEDSGEIYDDEETEVRSVLSCPPSVKCPAGQVCIMYKYPHCHIPDVITTTTPVKITTTTRSPRISYCENNICRIGSTCVPGNLPDNYSCLCVPGTTGRFCEVKSCTLFCRNGGTCIINKLDVQQCNCLAGWYGQTCESKGEACSPNPCLNNCNCVQSCMHEGGFYCVSTNMQYAGKTCNDPVPRLECQYDRMIMRVDPSLVRNFDKQGGNTYLYSSDSYNNHQRSSICRAKMEGGVYMVAIPFPFTNCGTVATSARRGDDGTMSNSYTNKLWLNKENNVYDMPYPVAEFTCTYGYEYNFVTSLSPTVQPIRHVLQDEELFDLTASFCKVSTCLRTCPAQYMLTGRAIYAVGEILHVRFDLNQRVSGSNTMVASIENLYLACSADNSPRDQVDLVLSGCSVIGTLFPTTANSLTSTYACFSFMVPRFKNCVEIYIHANIRMCRSTDVITDCGGKPRCRSNARRAVGGETILGPIAVVDGLDGMSTIELYPGANDSVVVKYNKVPDNTGIRIKPSIVQPTASTAAEADENYSVSPVIILSLIVAATCMALFALCCMLRNTKTASDSGKAEDSTS
uniref:Transmembrane protein Vc20 n=1 Tax=Ciona intestinalis TaxID=7719 RepID=A4ZW63_CIOIN|nr:transmembrane protein Vc20 [Ciona intestinalis]